MKREKKEIYDTLKAGDFKNKEDGTVILIGNLIEIRDVETKFGTKTVITIEPTQEDMEEPLNVFFNNKSNNNLVEAYGDEDENWKGKPVKVIKETDINFKKENLVVYANIEKA